MSVAASTSAPASAGWGQRAAVLGIAAVGCTAVLLRSPSVAGAYPPCPVFATTGCYCPGCGSMRAVAALLHGDVLAAVGLNALLLPALLWIAMWWVAPWTGRPAPSSRIGIYIGGAVVLAFTVARNIPGSPLAP